MSVVIAGLVGMFISKIFGDKQLKNVSDKIDQMDHILIRVDAKLEDIDTLKREVEDLYERIRKIESAVAVLESKN